MTAYMVFDHLSYKLPPMPNSAYLCEEKAQARLDALKASHPDEPYRFSMRAVTLNREEAESWGYTWKVN